MSRYIDINTGDILYEEDYNQELWSPTGMDLEDFEEDWVVQIGTLELFISELRALIEVLEERLILADFSDGPIERDRLIDQVRILRTIH